AALSGSRQRVAYGKIELVAHHDFRSSRQRDQRAAFFYKVVQGAHTVSADPAGIFGRQLFKITFTAPASFHDHFARRVGKDNHVVSAVEVAGLYFLVLDVLDVESVLLENEACPAFVDRGNKRFVEADARRLELNTSAGRSGDGTELKMQLVCICGKLRMRR